MNNTAPDAPTLPERVYLSRHYPCLYRLEKSSTEDIEYVRSDIAARSPSIYDAPEVKEIAEALAGYFGDEWKGGQNLYDAVIDTVEAAHSELTVERALAELREIREIGAFTLHISADTRNLYFRITIWPANPELSEFEIEGATLTEAMQKVREWKEKHP